MLDDLPAPVTLEKLRDFVQPEIELPSPPDQVYLDVPAYPRSIFVDRGSTFSLHDLPSSLLVGEVAPSIGAAIELRTRASHTKQKHTEQYKEAATFVRRLLELRGNP